MKNPVEKELSWRQEQPKTKKDVKQNISVDWRKSDDTLSLEENDSRKGRSRMQYHLLSKIPVKNEPTLTGKYILSLRKYGPAGALAYGTTLVNPDILKEWTAWCETRARLYGTAQILEKLSPLGISAAAAGSRAYHGKNFAEQMALGRAEYAEQLRYLARLVDRYR